jgi:GntR family transcriptional regulator/MocR family aminotransferase
LHIDRVGPRVRAGLEVALRDAVLDGRLGPGLRLPSSRALGVDLGIARNTVADAYGQLVAEGWLVARQGSGTRVANRLPASEAPPVPVSEPRAPRYDLRPGSPDSAAFPRTAWLSAARRALGAAPADALGYSDPRGLPQLRQALAGYLGRARGVHASAERIVICAGFTQALGLLCRVLRAQGATTVAVEAYGIQDHRRIVADSGLRVRYLPVDESGAELSTLRASDAVVLTAAHQFPLGVALAPTRRAEAVRWASRTGGVVIEDDYDGEFRYDRQPVGAMQALGPDHVIYAGTTSKSLAPGLRLGWLVLPRSLIEPVTQAQALAVRNLSAIDQLTLAELIASGGYDRHIRRSRLAYRRRRDQLLTAVGRRIPHAQITGIAAGLHALLGLPERSSEADIIARAAHHGLALRGLSSFASVEPPTTALVIGYGTPPDHAYTTALARLTAVLADDER